MLQLMYGGGLRHVECRRLRIKDIEVDDSTIVVRNGKGNNDRVTILPVTSRQSVIEQIERCRRQHNLDLENGFGEVYLPYALEKKYPSSSRQFCWQWLFPARQISFCKRTKRSRRHHVSEAFFGKSLSKALGAANIDKPGYEQKLHLGR